MVELDKVHDGVILDGVGYQRDSKEIRRLKSRSVRQGSTDRARLIQFNDGDYYVAAKQMENGHTDISTKDVRYSERRGLRGLFDQIEKFFNELSQQNGGIIR